MGNCRSCGDVDDKYPAADPDRVIQNILKFLEHDLKYERLPETDIQIIREYHHCADTFLRLLDQNETRKIHEEDLRNCFPNMQIAQEIYDLVLEMRYDFGRQRRVPEGEFRWDKLYDDVVCRKRTNAELAVPELKGVTWHKRYKSFAAKVSYEDKIYMLGFFPDRYAAARAYDDKLRQLAWDHPHDDRRLRKKMNFDEEKKRWWFREGDDDMKMGPYSWREIEEKARKNEISKDCCISDEKYSKDWLRLGDLQISGNRIESKDKEFFGEHGSRSSSNDRWKAKKF